MSEVQFEEIQPIANEVSAQKPRALIAFMIKAGFARTQTQAMWELVALSIVCLIAAGFIFYRAQTDTEIPSLLQYQKVDQSKIGQ